MVGQLDQQCQSLDCTASSVCTLDLCGDRDAGRYYCDYYFIFIIIIAIINLPYQKLKLAHLYVCIKSTKADSVRAEHTVKTLLSPKASPTVAESSRYSPPCMMRTCAEPLSMITGRGVETKHRIVCAVIIFSDNAAKQDNQRAQEAEL